MQGQQHIMSSSRSSRKQKEVMAGLVLQQLALLIPESESSGRKKNGGYMILCVYATDYNLQLSGDNMDPKLPWQHLALDPNKVCCLTTPNYTFTSVTGRAYVKNVPFCKLYGPG